MADQKPNCHPLESCYKELVCLYLVAKDAHLRTLATDFTFHGYTGDFYDAMDGEIDNLGEQLVNVGLRVPAFTQCINDASVNPIDTDDTKKIKSHLLEQNQAFFNCVSGHSKDPSLDEGSRTVLADLMLSHGKASSRLKSLL